MDVARRRAATGDGFHSDDGGGGHDEDGDRARDGRRTGRRRSDTRTIIRRCLTVKENCVIFLLLATMLGLEIFKTLDESLQLRALAVVLDFIKNRTSAACCGGEENSDTP
jgi:hypothetical protein